MFVFLFANQSLYNKQLPSINDTIDSPINSSCRPSSPANAQPSIPTSKQNTSSTLYIVLSISSAFTLGDFLPFTETASLLVLHLRHPALGPSNMTSIPPNIPSSAGKSLNTPSHPSIQQNQSYSQPPFFESGSRRSSGQLTQPIATPRNNQAQRKQNKNSKKPRYLEDEDMMAETVRCISHNSLLVLISDRLLCGMPIVVEGRISRI